MNSVTRVGVIGQGYVGLPLAIMAAKAGFQVIGIDNDLVKVQKLNSGLSEIEGIDNSELANLLELESYSVSDDYSLLSSVQVILVCVPTPVNESGLPDLNILHRSIKDIAKNISAGTLVILESSVAPGTTRELLFETILHESNLTSQNFGVAFSPERIDPMNKQWNLSNTPKVVAGLTEESRRQALAFYSKFIDTLVPCASLEIAEAAKLLENSFRLINISLINELAVFCNVLNININEVIDVASTKPYGYMPFFPSLGAGGHCIPVDPLYLAEKGRQINAPFHMIELASKINYEVPNYFIKKAEVILNGLAGKRILILGVAYKANVSDTRESPVKTLIIGLRAKGAKVFWHDELVKNWLGERSTAVSNDYDLAILATPHDRLDLTKLDDVPILNTRGSN